MVEVGGGREVREQRGGGGWRPLRWGKGRVWCKGWGCNSTGHWYLLLNGHVAEGGVDGVDEGEHRCLKMGLVGRKSRYLGGEGVDSLCGVRRGGEGGGLVEELGRLQQVANAVSRLVLHGQRRHQAGGDGHSLLSVFHYSLRHDVE